MRASFTIDEVRKALKHAYRDEKIVNNKLYWIVEKAEETRLSTKIYIQKKSEAISATDRILKSGGTSKITISAIIDGMTETQSDNARIVNVLFNLDDVQKNKASKKSTLKK